MSDSSLTPEQISLEIEKIYNEAIVRLRTLGKERDDIINDYIKELEQQKIVAIRASIGLPPEIHLDSLK
jgi:hypothetical protein